ncbi:MAG: methyltransferase [Deltaproteobacteria bacterium]|nr:methyltransferase [Deltaproteobacteria bacterium]
MHEQFSDATRFLAKTSFLWSPRPFREEVSWPDAFEDVAHWCLNLDDYELEAAEKELSLVSQKALPTALKEWRKEVERLVSLPSLGQLVAQHRQKEFFRGVKARKQHQIQSFMAALHPKLGNEHPQRILDWCAGKAHLSRSFAASKGAIDLPVDVLAFEIQPQLVKNATESAEKEALFFRGECQDVLQEFSDEAQLADACRGRHLFALHGCGALSCRALDAAVHFELKSVHVAGCCFHKFHARYLPRTELGKRAGLVLEAGDLHLPATDETVADPAKKAHRRRAMLYRAAFDELLREVAGQKKYTSTPALPRRAFADGFPLFVKILNERCVQKLPNNLSSATLKYALDEGEKRMARARRLGVVRGVFRRLIEVWIALDRGVSLQESGFDVEVGTFCSSAITPRNVMIRGWR